MSVDASSIKSMELQGLKDRLVKVSPSATKSEEKPAQIQKYPASMDLDEPLCIESKNRFVLFPIANQEIWSMYKKHVASFWTAEEIDLHDDHKDWARLNAKEQHFIKYILAFFAASGSRTSLPTLSTTSSSRRPGAFTRSKRRWRTS